MTEAERKAVQRLRRKRGFISLRGEFARLADLPSIKPYLLSAEEVDEAISEEQKKGEK